MVEVAEYLGADTFLYVALDGLETVLVRISGGDQVEEGSRVGLRFDESRMHFFDNKDQAVR
jgi:multiple sugar transport system ATP-binding protein